MTFYYENFGETINFAEDLGWNNWLDAIDDDTDPCSIDEAEQDALDFIKSLGYEIDMSEAL